MATAGGIFVYFGINDVDPLPGLRDLLHGKVPAGRAPKSNIDYTSGRKLTGSPSDPNTPDGRLVSAGGGPGGQAAQDVRKYLGIRYKYGGSQNPSVGFDCSGLVNWVLGHDLGLILPGQSAPGFSGSSHGPVTGDYYIWSGATDVGRSGCQAGDLVCWTGHIGIAVSPTRFIAAPTLGRTVTEEDIYWTPAPRIRRIKPQGGVTV